MRRHPSTARWRRSNGPEHQQRRPRRQPDAGPGAPAHTVRNRRHHVADRGQRPRKEGEEWQDAAYYFDVTVWGRTAENCAQYLAKGRPVGVQGKLTWREWDAQDGSKRQSVEVVADNIQFLGGRDGGGEGGGGGGQFVPQGASQPASDFPSAAADDDIPF